MIMQYCNNACHSAATSANTIWIPMEAAPEPVVYTDDEMELDEELEAVARYEECRMVLGMSESLTNFLEAERTNPGRYVHAPCA